MLGCYMSEKEVNRFKSYMAGSGHNISTLAIEMSKDIREFLECTR